MRRMPLLLIVLILVAFSFAPVSADDPGRTLSSPMPPFLTSEPSSEPTTAPTAGIPRIKRTGWLECRVYDALERRLLAARVELRDSKGKPAGGPAEGSPIWGRGSFRIRLPEGLYRIKAGRGPFTKPFKGVPFVDITANKTTKVDIPLNPWGPHRKNGWYAFDPFVHTACGSSVFHVPSLKTLALMSEAEGLDAVIAASPWWHNPPPNVRAVETPDGIASLAARYSSDRIKVGTTVLSNSRPYYGWFYRIGGPPPLTTKLPDDPGVPNAVEMARLKSLGAVIVLRNPSHRKAVRFASSKWGDMLVSAGMFGELHPIFEGYGSELPYDLLLGLVDALDIQDEDDMQVWYNALNNGFRLSALKSSGARVGTSFTALPHTMNYAYIRSAFNINSLAEAVAKGRLVVTEGPFIDFKIDNQPPGSVIPSDDRPHYATIRIYAPIGNRYVKKIKVIRNGKLLEASRDDVSEFGVGEVLVERALTIRESGPAWYIVLACDDKDRWSFTNPIYFRKPGVGFENAATLPETLSLSINDADGKAVNAAVSVVSGSRRFISVEHRASELPLVIKLRAGIPPSAEIVIAAPGFAEKRIGIFREFVFRRCIRGWCQARDNTPLLSAPSIYRELLAQCKDVKVEITLDRE